MRVAVLSDIHANVAALAAALADLDRRGADAVVVAGDLVGDGADPAGVVALLRSKRFPAVRGNVDDKVIEAASLPRGEQAALLEKRKKADLVRTARALDRGDLEWLRELPEALHLEFGGCRVELVHGSPLGVTDYVFPSITARALAAKLGADRPDVLACGHSHIPFARRIGGVTDGTPRARIVRFPFATVAPSARGGAGGR